MPRALTDFGCPAPFRQRDPNLALSVSTTVPRVNKLHSTCDDGHFPKELHSETGETSCSLDLLDDLGSASSFRCPFDS